MAQAVAGRDAKQFINGEWTGAADGKTYEKKNPFNGQLASQVAAGKREDARRAIEAAAAAFPSARAARLSPSRASVFAAA